MLALAAIHVLGICTGTKAAADHLQSVKTRVSRVDYPEYVTVQLPVEIFQLCHRDV